ncbi:MAG: LacI family DNA-binding transcriptional regulator [Paracoccaceae bacterium]
MAVTLKEVAERAGVSRSAVSRTFTEGASVSEPMRAKVLQAAEELGYSPNALASSLTTGRTKMIGLVSNNFHNPVFLQVFDLFTRGLQDLGLRPLLMNLTDENDPQESVRMMRQYSVDGVVIASSTLPASFATAFRQAGIPVVHSFARHTDSPNVHMAGIDNVEAGRLAARTLIERGYQYIGFLGGPNHATSTQDRLTGFRSEMQTRDRAAPTVSFASNYSFDAGRAAMSDLIHQHPAEVYFCGDDVIAIGALSAISSAGLQCPETIGILGLNDMEIAGWENISLTTIHQPIEEIVNASIELVTLMLEEPARIPEARLFPCHVVERCTLRPIGT